jgi:hypothetical protein
MSDRTLMKSILLLAANPKGTKSLRLQEEEREIKERLRLAGYGKIPINSSGATRPRDIQQAMLDCKPQVVHFSGHGAGKEGLVFEDGTGQEKLVDSEALANLFRLFTRQYPIECVVLNACYSEVQAQAIARHVDYVIGMSQAIGDQAAIEFSVGFYNAVGAGESFKFAYELGCLAIQLEGISEYLTPILWEKGQPPSKPPTETDDLSSERGVDYTKLRDLLAQGKWKEADEETLLVMLKVAGREEDDWLRAENIEEFPCTDLRTIDTLWVKYSKGRFGFSVQKRIWESVGGTPNAGYETYKRFSDRVKWRVDNDWLDYRDLDFTFTPEAPEGHLPAAALPSLFRRWEYVTFVRVVIVSFSSLAQRLVNCSI